MLAYLKILVFVLISYAFGKTICREKFERTNLLQDLVVHAAIGMSSHLLICHLLSFLTQSFSKSVWISLVLMTLTVLIARVKIFEKHELDIYDGLATVTALAIAVVSQMRYQLVGDSARFHYALIGSITNNDIYPPIYPSNHELSMSFYHFGLDLFASNLKIISGVSTISSSAMQVAVTAFLAVLAIFMFFRFFIESRAYAFFAAFFYMFISLNAIEYFFREIAHFGTPRFFEIWSQVLNIYGSGGINGGRGGLFNITLLSLILLILTRLSKLKEVKFPIGIVILSFFLYMFKSSLWTIVVLATALACAILVLKAILKKEQVKELIFGSALLGLSLYLGKVICFCKALSFGFNGIDPVAFAPSWNWTMHSPGFFKHFYSMDYLSQLPSLPDLTHATQRPQASLFSTMALRKFGALFLLALSLLFWQFSRKKINKSSYLLLIALCSLPIPFLLVFVPKPFETLRFTSFVAISSNLFLFINLGLIAQEMLKNSKLSKIIIIAIALFFSVPGIKAALPIGAKKSYGLPSDKLIKALEQVHQSGDVILDTQFMHLGHHISELAGFYGIGGQMYKADMRSRWTAMESINPLLLEELKVNYVLITPQSKISKLGQSRLVAPQLFEEIPSIRETDPNYRLYRFKGSGDLTKEQRQILIKEYQWVLGYTVGEAQFAPHKIDGKIYTASNKAALKTKMEEVRQEILKQNKSVAIYTCIQAILR
ncbi:MAG: hypothetical protein OXU45_07585 [Candidatus Melainabacteria bacterium]|nr:hypothetical protein [Candidatus Melainabacteria bacterium]